MARKDLSRVLQLIVLILSCALAFLIRQFANVINEPIIHELDPHFNWRCTKYIDKHGIYEFLGWFDNISWYPQGRPVGETSYPGLMVTAAMVKWSLHKIHIFVPLIDVCIFIGSFVSILSVLVAFLFGLLIDSSQLGVLCAAITSFIPGMMSRSIGGAYDYECIALFIIVLAFYTFALALKDGSILVSTISGFVYAYLSFTWGGYVFVSNCVPLFVAAMIALGRYTWRLHVSYSIWAIVGTLLTAQIPFIGDKILKKPEHFLMIGVFIGLQVWGIFTFVKRTFSPSVFNTAVVSSIMLLPAFILIMFTVGVSTGLLGGFSGRLMQMFDPSYATKNIPIIASVAEHQPTSWGKYFIDCSLFLILFPIGAYITIRVLYYTDHNDDENLKKRAETMLLVLMYGVSTLYFASIMVRLVLVFTPALALIAGIGIHQIMKAIFRKKEYLKMRGIMLLITIFGICIYTVLHAVWFACYSYSSDHIHFTVVTPRGQETSDDYREGYRWLTENTHEHDVVMSWWDYGYQITSMGNRGCIADGNTNNFTHIGIIGMTMSSPEAVSWRLARMLGVSYMLVVFGGATHYSSDDINKFLWMPRIANQTFTNISGDMYQINPYSNVVGAKMTENMTNSALFKFCYHHYKSYTPHPQFRPGFDITRNTAIPNINDISLSLYQEAFTSKNWIIRIYRVLPDPNWDRVY